MDDVLTLGGSIELSGFKDIDASSMIILKKMIGNHARKLSGLAKQFEKLVVTKKPVHESKIEVKAKLIDNGKTYHAETVDHNVFMGVGAVLKKLQNSMT